MKNKEITKQNLEKVKTLLENVKSISNEQFREILDSIAQFHHYSFYNQVILHFSGCSQVAGYKKWQELGRTVKKGARAVWILAPYLKKEIVEDDEGKEKETKALAGFFSVPVFDISDTEGEEIKKNFTTRSKISLDILKNLTEKEGFTVRFRPLEIEKGGYIKEKEITLNSNLNETENVGTLIHELAHGLLEHQSQNNGTSTQIKEQQAETATYLACKVLGVERKSEFYLRSWGLSENIIKDFQKIDKVVKKIIKSALVPAKTARAKGVHNVHPTEEV